MQSFFSVCALLAMAAALSAQASTASSKVYSGVISETMCGINHTPMGITPDPKCIVECVKHGRGVRYALVIDAKTMYTLSDQQTPERFAGQRVTVRGVLYPKTNILKVETITPQQGH